MRIPIATYRLQFGPSLRFQDARALVPYLADLGISDLYASPILKATPGSTHGYDVTDPDELNPELGTEEDFQALVAEVQAHQLGWLQDIVPNHMAYSSENRMLMDIFENGPRSRFYEFFDIFRDHPDPELRTRVLAPFLSNPLEEVLQQGQMQLILDDDGLALRYFTWRLPLCLTSYDDVLGHGDKMSGSQGGDDPATQAFMELRESFACLSGLDDSSQKRRQLAGAKKTLVRLHRDHPMIRMYLDGVLESYNRPPAGPMEHSPLYRLLEQQVFKPVFWQTAYETINYRRFFYLSEFIALRTEDPRVFQRVHGKILELVRAGVLTGLRVDHIDGLYNPRQYLCACTKRRRRPTLWSRRSWSSMSSSGRNGPSRALRATNSATTSTGSSVSGRANRPLRTSTTNSSAQNPTTLNCSTKRKEKSWNSTWPARRRT